MAKMKIVLVSSLFGISGGGAGLAVQQLSVGLLRKGHEVVVVKVGNVKGTVIEIIEGLKIITFRPASFYLLEDKDAHPAWQKVIWQILDIYNPSTGSRLRKILEAENPDIIHIHKMRGLSGAVWGVAARVAPGRVVQTCHDFESMSPMGTLSGWVGQFAREGKWLLSWYQILRSGLSKGANVVTAPSAFALDLIKKSKLFPMARQQVAPNAHGLTLDELRALRDRTLPESNTTNLLYLGRLEPEKGVLELCAAVVSLSKRFHAVSLTIAGWGSLEKKLDEVYGKSTNIKFAGRVAGPEKAHLLSAADLVVIPSTGLESFGMVAIEAYAYGKPVIAAHSGGLVELVKEDETGWLVQPGNVDELANAIAVAIRHPEKRLRMSAACFELAKQFTIEVMLQKYENIYIELLKERPRGNYAATK